jgi:predicted ATP-dependent serine protease
MFKVLALATKVDKKTNSNAINLLAGIITKRDAIKKLVEQIVPRFQGSNQQRVRIVNMEQRRLGDNAEMAFIELTGNDLAKYEEAVTLEKVIKSSQSIGQVRHEGLPH